MYEARLTVYVFLARAGRFDMARGHQARFTDRHISRDTVAAAVAGANLVVVEAYGQDARGNATLVLGYVGGRPLHMVLTVADPFRVVTAYWPDERPGEWSADFPRRLP